MIGLCINIGIFFAFLISFGLSANVLNNLIYWRIVLGIPIIFPLLRSLAFLIYYTKDTPVYYLLNGQEDLCI